MKKEFILTTALILTLATPVLGASKNDNAQNSQSNPPKHGVEIQQTKKSEKVEPLDVEVTPTTIVVSPTSVTVTPTPTKVVSPSTSPCDPNKQWKNHGEYVNCVAKLKMGGQYTSEAARSDVGKKKGSPTPSAHVSISPVPSISPDLSPTPSASISPTPSSTPTAELTAGMSPLNSVGEVFGKMFGFLKNLFKHK